MQLWQIHVAEQMILDDWLKNPEKYKGKKLSELTDDEDFNEQNSAEYGQAYHKKTVLPKMTLVRNLTVNFDTASNYNLVQSLIWAYFVAENKCQRT